MTAQHADELMFTEALPLGTPEERSLATAFKSGAPDAYRTIHDRYAPRVHSVCRRMLHNPDDAAEAAQETFLRIYQGLPAFNGRYRLGAWVVRIATNVCLDQLRARSRRPAELTPLELLDLESAPVDESDPAILFMRHAEGKKVRKILQSLPPMHRAAIVLRDFEGVPYADIAETLGISECQVKALLHRARRGFKKQWSISFASALAPLFVIKRLIRPVKTDAATHISPASQTAETAITTSHQITAVASQAFQSCSGMIQGCGQFLTEKAAPVVTAVVVGTATVGAVAIKQSRQEEPPAVVQQVAPAMSTTAPSSPQPPSASAQLTDEKKMIKSSAITAKPLINAPSEAPPQEQTVPTPTPTPSTPPSDASGGISPEPSPPPPPVVPEPQDFTFSFASDLPGEGEPCPCVPAGTEVVLSRIATTEQDGLISLDHLTRSAASAAGTPFYGLELRHIVNPGRGHAMDFVLQRPEGMFRYAATGARVEKLQTDWGGWLYRYAGTYRLYSRPGGHEVMPISGRYTAELTVSWKQNRVLSSTASLTEG